MLPWWLSGKELACSAGDSRDVGSIPGSRRSPGEGNGNPLQCSCLENSMDRGALAGCSPWGCKESDKIEWLSTDTQRVNSISMKENVLWSLGQNVKSHLWIVLLIILTNFKAKPSYESYINFSVGFILQPLLFLA